MTADDIAEKLTTNFPYLDTKIYEKLINFFYFILNEEKLGSHLIISNSALDTNRSQPQYYSISIRDSEARNIGIEADLVEFVRNVGDTSRKEIFIPTITPEKPTDLQWSYSTSVNRLSEQEKFGWAGIFLFYITR